MKSINKRSIKTGVLSVILSVCMALIMLPASAAQAATTTELGDWVQQSFYGGYITNLVEISDGLYATTYGGIYKWDDSEQQWTGKNTGLPGTTVYDLIETSDGLYAAVSNAVYKWDDAEQKWTPLAADYQTLMLIESLAELDGVLYAGTATGSVLKWNSSELTWEDQSTGLPGTSVYTLAILSDGLYVTNYTGVYKWNDSELTWELFGSGLSSVAPYAVPHEILETADGIYASTSRGVYKYDDSELAWVALVPEPTPPIFTPNIYAQSILETADGLYIGSTNGVYKFDANEIAWTAQNNGLSGNNLHINVLIEKNGTLYIGTYGGVLKWNADTLIWEEQNTGMTGTRINSLLKTSDTLYAAAYGGVFKRNNGELTWTQQNAGLGNMYINDIIQTSDGLYVIDFGDVYKWNTTGLKWENQSNGLPTASSVGTLIEGPDGLYFGDLYGVYKWDSSDSTWKPQNTGIEAENITSLLVTSDGFYAGARNKIFKWNAEGTVWEAQNIQDSTLIRVNTLLETSDGLYALDIATGVYKWNEGALEWQKQITASMWEFGMFYAMLEASGELYLGTSTGIYKLNNTSQQWEAQNKTGLTGFALRFETLLEVDGYLYAGTDGGGLWAAEIKTVTVDDPPTQDPPTQDPPTQDPPTQNPPVSSVSPATTVSVNGTTLPYTIDKDMQATIKLTQQQVTDLLKAVDTNGNLNLSVTDKEGAAGYIEGVKGGIIEINLSAIPTDGSIQSLTISVSGITVTLGIDAIKSIKAKLSTLVLTITQGSIIFSMTDINGKSVAYSGYDQPIIISMPYTLPQDINTNYLVMAEKLATGTVIAPRSWYADGSMYAKVYTDGTFDVQYVGEADFTDITGHWGTPAINYMAARSIVNGVGEDKFDANGTVTKAQFITMLMRMLDITMPESTQTAQFADQAVIPAWAAAHAFSAKALGIGVADENNNFNPNELINRQEMFLLAYEMMDACGMLPDVYTLNWIDFTDWDSVDEKAADAIQNLAKLHLVNGNPDGTLNPNGTSTRAEAAQFLSNILKYDTK